MSEHKRCTWKPVAGTELQWPIKNPNGTRVIRYDRYQEYRCAVCGGVKHAPVKGSK